MCSKRAFSQEPPPEITKNASRVGRVTPLSVWGVSAPEECAGFRQMRVVPRKVCLSSRMWDGGRFLYYAQVRKPGIFKS